MGPESAFVNQATRNSGQILAPFRAFLHAFWEGRPVVPTGLPAPWLEAFPEPDDLRTAQNPGATRRSASGNRVCAETPDTGEPRLVWMVDILAMVAREVEGRWSEYNDQWWQRAGVRANRRSPWLSHRGQRVLWQMNAATYACHTSRQTAAAVGSIHSRCDRPRRQWPSTQ